MDDPRPLRPEPSDAEIGAAVAAARHAAGLTQVEVARRIGVSQSRVARLETGARRLTFAQAVVLSELYATDLTAFVPDGDRSGQA